MKRGRGSDVEGRTRRHVHGGAASLMENQMALGYIPGKPTYMSLSAELALRLH